MKLSKTPRIEHRKERIIILQRRIVAIMGQIEASTDIVEMTRLYEEERNIEDIIKNLT